jgi:hypothetical protein
VVFHGWNGAFQRCEAIFGDKTIAFPFNAFLMEVWDNAFNSIKEKKAHKKKAKLVCPPFI